MPPAGSIVGTFYHILELLRMGERTKPCFQNIVIVVIISIYYNFGAGIAQSV